FDTGVGLPPPADHRDHPELYEEGWCPQDRAALERELPDNARVVYGDLRDTIDDFGRTLSPGAPLGFGRSTSTTTARHGMRSACSSESRRATSPPSTSTSTTFTSARTRASRVSSSRSTSSTWSTSRASSSSTAAS